MKSLSYKCDHDDLGDIMNLVAHIVQYDIPRSVVGWKKDYLTWKSNEIWMKLFKKANDSYPGQKVTITLNPDQINCFMDIVMLSKSESMNANQHRHSINITMKVDKQYC
jgi:hypothetical protein